MTYADLQGPGPLPTADRVAAQPRTASRRRSNSRLLERVEMKLLVALTYPLFLAVVAVSRLGLRRPRFDAIVVARSKSIFAEARETAEATIPSAFRG